MKLLKNGVRFCYGQMLGSFCIGFGWDEAAIHVILLKFLPTLCHHKDGGGSYLGLIIFASPKIWKMGLGGLG